MSGLQRRVLLPTASPVQQPSPGLPEVWSLRTSRQPQRRYLGPSRLASHGRSLALRQTIRTGGTGPVRGAPVAYPADMDSQPICSIRAVLLPVETAAPSHCPPAPLSTTLITTFDPSATVVLDRNLASGFGPSNGFSPRSSRWRLQIKHSSHPRICPF